MENEATKTANTANPLLSRSSRGVIAIALLALVLAISGIGGGFYIWQQSLAAQVQASKKIVGLQTTLLQTQVALVRQQHALASAQQELQQVTVQTQWKNQDWVLAESNYLLQRAVFALMFEKNVVLAREFLVAADKRVQTLPALTTVLLRQALAADIVALSTAPVVDVPGILMRISAISRKVEQLPRLAAPEKQIVQSVEVPAPVTWSWANLKELSLKIAGSLKGLVAIHYDVPTAAPLLPPDQYVYVITNIQTQFALAEWAVLHRQPEVYQSSLDQALTWLQRYFPLDNPVTKGLIAEIQSLRTANVNPALPDLSPSIFAMHALWSKTSP